MLPVRGLALGSFRGWLSGAGPARVPATAASAVLLWWLSVVSGMIAGCERYAARGPA
jgi:hypothetical protein